MSSLVRAAIVICFAVGAVQAAAATAPPSKPNIVIVLCDDLGYGDLGCFGATKWATPNIDRLAADGVRLTSFYACPMCTAARASLITGRYPWRTGMTKVLSPNSTSKLSDSTVTIASALKAAGYATGMVGKWHLGDLPEALPIHHGFDSWLGMPYSNDKGLMKGAVVPSDAGPTPAPGGKGTALTNAPLMEGERIIQQPTDQCGLTARYTTAAVKFIETNRDKPFFLYLAHSMPHIPVACSAKFAGSSKGGLYGDVVQELDWSVGEVLAALDRTGVAGRTLVVFTSDNGPWLSVADHGSAGPLRGGKLTNWEGGIREPTVIRLPGVLPAGQERRAVGSLIDLLPTVVRLAGGSIPNDLDGVDLWPMLSGADKNWQRPPLLLGSTAEAVREGRWKLHLKKGELYDLEADIGETTDVAAANPDVVTKLRAAGGGSATKGKTAKPPVP